MEHDPVLKQALRTSQILALGILAGPALFAVVIPIVQGSSGGAGLAGEPVQMLDPVAAIVSVSMIPTAFIVRRQIRAGAAGGTPVKIAKAYLIGTVMFMSLLEAGMLFDLVVWLLNGEPVPPAIAAGLLWLIGLVNFPRQTQFDRHVEECGSSAGS